MISIPAFLRWAAPIMACLLPYWGVCQIPAPPGNIQSPNVAAFATYGDIPVSQFTGKPDISVNLHNLSDGNVQIPITLYYDPSGVRPDVHPGWTGLNFSLSTTYAVTRQIKDGPDDCPNYGTLASEGWFFHSAVLNTPSPAWNDPTKMVSNTEVSTINDLEPDEYSFSLPGLSGKFYYGQDQKWKIVCDRPITVDFIGTTATVQPPFNVPEFISGGGNPWQSAANGYLKHMEGFIIKDEFGTEYTFGGGDAAYSEYSIDFFAQGKSTWFCNNWYLKSIKRQTGQIITFKYERGPFVAQMNFSVLNKKYQVNGTGGFLNVGCSGSSSIMPLSGPYSGKLISPIYLTEINADNFKVKYTSSISSELPYEESVFSQFVADHINNNNGRMQDILTFLYSCFYPTYSGCDASGEQLSSLLGKLKWKKLDNITIQNGAGTTIKEYLLTYNNVSTERLMLKKIQEKSGYNTDVLPPYEFTYYTASGLSLPGYGKSHTDHWGYNNGILINQNNDFSSVSTYGANFRRPPTDTRHYMLGSLTEIKYPTGGITRFKFEPHTYRQEVKLKRWEGLDPLPENRIAGGLRIKEIQSFDPINHRLPPLESPVPWVIKRYYYINGFNAANPDTTTLASSGILGGKSQYWWPDYAPKPNGSYNYIQQVFSTQSVLPQTENAMGTHIGYSQVVENSSTGGWTVYSFSNFDNGSLLDAKADGYLQTTTTAYEPYNSNAFKRGKLVEKKVYFQGGKLAQRTVINYNVVGILSESLSRSFKSSKTAICNQTSNFVYEGTAYVINTQKFLPHEEIVYDYDQDIETRSTFASVKTSYKANGQVAATFQTDSKTSPTLIPVTPIGPSYDRQIVTEYKYANDYTNPSTDAISIDMAGRNMIAAPIETTKRLLTIPQGGTSLGYQALNWQKVTYKATRLPEKVESKLGSGPNVTEYEFLTYDSRGNLLTFRDKSGSTTKLDYYGTTDIGKVDQVKSRTTADGSPIPQTTLYDYKPLVGISKITDPNGKVIDYEYDNFNRLSAVKSGNLARASYCYNYAGQTVKCTALAPFGSIAAATPALLPDDALPVTLVEFTARKAEQTALLQWSTTSESNSREFEIQRSNDGKDWQAIGTVGAKGESSELQRYSFTDMEPRLNKQNQKPQIENLYRLKMIDLDETFAYSRIQSLTFDNGDGVSLFPNPITVGNNLNISIADISSIKEIKVFDAAGQKVLESGAARKIDTNAMAAGLYIVEITYKDGSITTHRIVKQ